MELIQDRVSLEAFCTAVFEPSIWLGLEYVYLYIWILERTWACEMRQETHNGVRQHTSCFGLQSSLDRPIHERAGYIQTFRGNRNWIWTIGEAVRKFLGNIKQDLQTPSFNKMAMEWELRGGRVTGTITPTACMFYRVSRSRRTIQASDITSPGFNPSQFTRLTNLH
jgi:hypothetical protein